MGNIRYQRTAHRITSAVNCRPLKPSPRSICPAAPYPTGVHIPGIPPPAKFATEPDCVTRPVSEHDQPHMWNGPRCKELLNRFHPRGRCVHMYGLEARYMTAGLDEIRETRS